MRPFGRELAAAMTAILALEPLADLGSGCTPACMFGDLIKLGDGEAAALVAHGVDRRAAFS